MKPTPKDTDHPDWEREAIEPLVPLVSDRAVLYLCGTVLILGILCLIGLGMWLSPDYASSILCGLAIVFWLSGVWGSLIFFKRN